MKAKLPTIILLLLLLATIFLASSFAQVQNTSAVVRVAAETTLKLDRFTLGDIAEVHASDESVAERLRAVALGYVPHVGAVRELTAERIRLAVAAANLSGVRIEAPAIVRVKRSSQIIDQEIIRTVIEAKLLAGLQAEGATARLARLDLPPVTEVPSGEIEVRVANSNVRNLFAPFTVGVELLVNGIVAKRLSLTTQVEAVAPTLVAVHDILPNAKVRPEDVRTELRPLRQVTNHLSRAAELRGYAARTLIAKGETVTIDKLHTLLIVKAGDNVRIEGIGGRVSVSVAGEARGSGRVGDRIRVKNIQSNQMLQGVIVDEGVVQVRF